MNASIIDHLARSRRNQFTAVRLNRDVELRDDAGWVNETLIKPNTRLVPLWRSRSLLQRDDDGTLAVYLSSEQLAEPDRIQPPTLLGNDGVREYFAVSVTDSQKDAILEQFPKAEGKTVRLMEYLWNGDANEVRDIPDPTGQNLVDYEEFINAAHAEVDRIYRELGREGII
jgi:hypothetical protein